MDTPEDTQDKMAKALVDDPLPPKKKVLAAMRRIVDDNINHEAEAAATDDGAVSPHPDFTGQFIYLGDVVKARRANKVKPAVGPYNKEGMTPGGKQYVQTTEVWILEDLGAVVFYFPKNKAFRPAQAKGIGDYLTMQRHHCEVMLVDGLKPTFTEADKKANYVVGHASIRVKRISASHGKLVKWYLYIKMEPTTLEPTCKVRIGTEPKGERSYGYDSNDMTISVCELAEPEPVPEPEPQGE